VKGEKEKLSGQSFSKEKSSSFGGGIETSGSVGDRQRTRFMFTKLTVLIFVFVCVRGPLFRVEDLTELRWDRVSSWKVLRNLVKAGVLQKFDRKSYGLTEDARKWFRSAFGGGANDAAFAYSVMGTEAWSKVRLDYFKAKLTSLWEDRPERVKKDPARAGLMSTPDGKEEGVEYFSALEALLLEKVEESHYLASAIIEKRRTTNIAHNNSQ
jgi:hypothetical protein